MKHPEVIKAEYLAAELRKGRPTKIKRIVILILLFGALAVAVHYVAALNAHY
jgi:hypothetical protein